MRGIRHLWLVLAVLALVSIAACKTAKSGAGLGDGPPEVDANTHVLGAFDPVALADAQSGGALDPSKAVSGPPPVPTPPPLPAPAVLDYGPMGEASSYPDIQIRFNRAMVPLGEKHRISPEEAGLRITPKIAGQVYWAEPTRLVFEPADVLPPATDYRVQYEATVAAVDGPSLDVKLDWSFGTEPPDISMWPEDEAEMGGSGGIHAQARVLVSATQEISLAELRAHTRAEAIDAQGKTAAVEVRVRKLSKTERDWSGAEFEVRPATRWPAASEVTIFVDEKLRGRLGRRPMGVEAAFSLQIAAGVEVESVRCTEGEYNDGCELGPVYVTFTAPIRRGQAKRVSMSPAEKGSDALAIDRDYDWTQDPPKARDRYSSVMLWGEFERGKTYTIRVDDGLKDVYGQSFAGEDSFEISFIEPPPVLTVREGSGTLAANSPVKLGVDTRHVESLDLRVAVLDPAAAAVALTRDNVRDFWPKPSHAKTIEEVVALTTRGKFGWASQDIDLNRYLAGKPGAVIFDVGPNALLARAKGRQLPKRQRGFVQVTNLGVTALGSLPGGLVRVARLSDDREVAGAVVEALPRGSNGKDAVALGETDSRGLLELPSSTELPVSGFLRVSSGDDSVIVDINGLGVESYRSETSPLRSGESVRATLMTERSLYQAGEVVRAMGWAAIATPYELSGLRPLPDSPTKVEVVLELRDHRDELISTRTVRAKDHGKFWATLPIPEGVGLGNYSVTARLLATTVSASLQVKDFPIPQFEVRATSEHADLHHGESTTISVDASYYFGGRVPIKQLRHTTECRVRHYRPPGVEPSWITAPTPDPYRGFGYGRVPAIAGPLGPEAAQGRQSYPLTLSSTRTELSELCTHSVAVGDLSKQEVGAEVNIWAHPDYYLATETPRVLEHGDNLEVPLRTLEFDGSPRPVSKLEVHLIRRWSEPEFETDKQGDKRFIGWEEKRKELPVCTTSSAADGVTSCAFPKLEHGSYELVIRGNEAGKDGYQPTIERWLWVRRPDAWTGAPQPPVEHLTLELSDAEPQVGDTIEIKAAAPWQDGAALLVLAKGGVHEYWPLRLTKGQAAIKLPVEESWVPGVHFAVYAIAPVTNKRPLPTVQDAHASAKLGPGTRELSVTIQAPRVAQTGETLAIEVRAVDHLNKPAPGHVSVWAVDEAIHALSPPQIPSFVETFVVGFGTGVSLAHGYGALILPFVPRVDPYTPRTFDPGWLDGGGFFYGSGSGGGGSGYGGGHGSLGGKSGSSMPAARQNFSSAPIFIGDAELGDDGVARVKGKLPDNLTTFRLSAVVSSPLPPSKSKSKSKSKAKVEPRFGLADARVRVTQALVVRAAKPRVMRPGDSAELGLIVDNLGGGAGELHVSLSLFEAKGVLELVGKREATLTVKAGEQIRVPFNIRALATGTPEVELRATLTPTAAGPGKAGEVVHDALRLPLPIEAERTLSDRVAVYGSLDDEGAALLPFAIPTQIDPNYGGLSVSIGSTILGGVEDAVDYLVKYPYGCVEQTSSSLLPLIPLGQLAKQGYPLGIDDTDAYVRVGIERLRSMQLASGGFSYWPGGTLEAPYASGYATWVLGRARAAGYNVPADMLERADDYLLGRVEAWQSKTAPPEGENIEIALLLWSLSERGKAPAKALDKLHGVRQRLPVFARAMATLAIAAHDPNDPRIPELLNELRAPIDEREAVAKVETNDAIWTWYWDSNVRSSAITLMAMLALDPDHPLVSKLTRGLLEARRGGRWANTQENAFALLALADYARIYEADEPDFEGRVWLANQPVTAIQIRGRGFGFEDGFTPMEALLAAVHGQASPAAAAGGGSDNLILERAGRGRMYYRVGLEWVSTATSLPAKAEGVAIRRILRGAEGTLGDAPSIESGALIALDVELDVRAELDYLAAEIPLPAGLEAVDMELGKGTAAMRLSGVRAGWVSHQELRRDRAVIFADRLVPGTHRTTVFLRATTPGEYQMPAASAELMYYPEIYGRSEAGRVTVR